MMASIDSLGRVVIPKRIRDRLGLRGGEPVEIEEHDGVVEIRPKVSEVRVVDTPEGPVAEPIADLPPLDDETIRQTLERTRR